MTRHVETDLYTIADLARSLDLPESTTRYYCNRFAEHLPAVGEGRRRRYKPETLPILRTIAETMRRDKNAFAVDLALRNGAAASAQEPHAPHTGNPPAEAEHAAAPLSFAGEEIRALLEAQTRALEDIAASLRLLLRQSEGPCAPGASSGLEKAPSPAAPPGPDTAAGTDTAMILAEIAGMREQMRTAEEMHQTDLEQLRKWLARLNEAVTAK